jgi:hypothetical protein
MPGHNSTTDDVWHNVEVTAAMLYPKEPKVVTMSVADGAALILRFARHHQQHFGALPRTIRIEHISQIPVIRSVGSTPNCLK